MPAGQLKLFALTQRLCKSYYVILNVQSLDSFENKPMSLLHSWQMQKIFGKNQP